MEGQTEFVRNILQETINKGRGLKAGTIISGVGIKGESHLGLKLMLLQHLPKGEYVDCEFLILSSGNSHRDLEKYVKKEKILNLSLFSSLKDKYFRQEFFTKESNLKKCSIRFKIGESAKVIAFNNSGLKVKVVHIEKYPDDPDTDNDYFGAYYKYEITGNKLDKYLEKI